MAEEFLKAVGGQPVARPILPREDLRLRRQQLAGIALEHNTRRGYAAGARDYGRFCYDYGLPLDPTVDTLADYIAYTSTFVKVDTATGYLTGAKEYLRAYAPSLIPLFESSRADPEVRRVIRGGKKDRADPIRRKEPLLVSHLWEPLRAAFRTRNYDDLLFVTLLSCAFYGCHRMAELIQKEPLTAHSAKKVIQRTSLVFADGRAQYWLPYHKGDALFTGTLIMQTKHNVADPVALLRHYSALRDERWPREDWLFVTSAGVLPNRPWFESRLFALVDRTRFGGHSARAGGATYYASQGHSEEVIMALGRWSSTAWRDYIRVNPAVRVELERAERLRQYRP